MTASHKRAEVPKALDGWRLLRLLCVVIGVTAFGLGLYASSPVAGGFGMAQHTAVDLERVVGVEFRTPEQPVRYTARIYSDPSEGQPEGLLFERTGVAEKHGYYNLSVPNDVILSKAQTVVANIRFEALDGSGQVAPNEYTQLNLLSAPISVPEATSISTFVVATAPPLLAGTPVDFIFTAAGTTAADAMTWVMKFGDGTADATGAGPSPLTLVTVSHTYNLAGTYTVSLTVLDTKDSTSATATLQLTLHIPVTATADPNCGLAPLNTCFTADATNGTPPYAYTWDFGDGTAASSDRTPCHAYIKSGTYTAQLSVVDAIGATGSTTVTVSALSPLSVTLTPSSVDGIPVTVVNFCASVTGGLPPFTYTWDFGDSSSATGVKCPQHAYGTVGTYTATVTVADSCQLSGSATSTIVVHKAPWIRITSPADGSLQHAQVNLTSLVVVEPNVTVTRVDYYVNGIFLGSSSVAPYSVTWDTRGINGTFCFSAIAYDSLGRSNSTENDVCIRIANPTVDGQVVVAYNPFRLRIFGNYFQPGCKVFINSMPAPASLPKSRTLVVAKGNAALKAMLPKGLPVIISVVNPDGGVSLGSTFVR